jgi:hypothetical protein
MRSLRIVLRELSYRRVNVALTIAAVALGVASLISARVVLRASDRETEHVLAVKEAELADKLAYLKNEMRLAMLKLKFNLVILPEGQNVREWHTKGTASGTMPEEYVERLADSGIITVRHFLPSLQKKIEWPEMKRRIILVGSRGEVPNLHKSQVKPLVQSVPDGTIVLGHELHRSLGLEPGDRVTLLGREFTVHRCHEERGSQDDVTAWIPLKDAQELLGEPGRINAILALECLCAGGSAVDVVRADIAKVLPGTQVLEQGSKALARAEARIRLGKEAKQALADEAAARSALRAKRERTAALVVPFILAACGIWVAVLTLLNTRERVREIAVLRSFGCGGVRILGMILSRPMLAALPGAVLGIVLGIYGGRFLAHWLIHAGSLGGNGPAFPLWYGAVLTGAAVLVAGMAAWLPAVYAIRRDPAEALHEH